MKRYCKQIDITDRNLISLAAYQCLDGKITRFDTLRMLAKYSGLTHHQIYTIHHRYGERYLDGAVELVIDAIQEEILNRSVDLVPIWYKEKVDPSSHKVRKIGIQNVKQQIYDYIAVNAMEPILKRIGEHQYASIPERGPDKGVARIRRWMKDKEIRYIAKADVKKCFNSIRKENVMAFLQKYIANEPLLWLIETLLDTFDGGLSIGSYLSQHLCNLYMSQLYHEIAERMYRIRKQRAGNALRVRLVKRQLLYMDDLFLAGSSCKDIHAAIKNIMICLRKMGLKLKNNWIVTKCAWTNRCNDKRFMDIMGRRIYRWHVTIRRRVFLRVRRAYKKALKCIQTHRSIPERLARKCMSYWGQIKRTDSYKIRKKYKAQKVRAICRRRLSKIDKSKVSSRAAGSPDCNTGRKTLCVCLP